MINRFRKNFLPRIALLFMAAESTASSANSFVDEHTLLATLLRELNTIDRLTTLPVAVPDQESRRFHFDYVRLRADIHRVSSGIQQYLAPKRATPRDDIALHGDYRDEPVTDQ
jgi:RAQPRD family integrative conjugative element protein